MQYDIMQIEDDSTHRMSVERAAKRCGLTYHGDPSLQALEGTLTSSSARVYVVDGRFPVIEGQAVQQNAHSAFASIRKIHPGARIVLFSAERDAESVAKEHAVDYRSKGDYTSGKLVEELKVIRRSLHKTHNFSCGIYHKEASGMTKMWKPTSSDVGDINIFDHVR